MSSELLLTACLVTKEMKLAFTTFESNSKLTERGWWACCCHFLRICRPVVTLGPNLSPTIPLRKIRVDDGT
jgi:hypothetical protein